jgi:hypothetical protein
MISIYAGRDWSDDSTTSLELDDSLRLSRNIPKVASMSRYGGEAVDSQSLKPITGRRKAIDFEHQVM